MSDLLERLRGVRSGTALEIATEADGLCQEAADAIEHLTERCAGIDRENEDWRARALQQQTLYIEASREIERLSAKLATVVEECAGIAESHVGAANDPNYDEACRDIAKAILDEFAQPGHVSEIDRLRNQLVKSGAALYAFRNADEEDWARLYGFLDYSGHGRFWRDVFTEFRHAIGGMSLTDEHGTEVQDTWLVGGPPDLMAMSGSIESDRVIQLHFRRKVTDDDRKWLLDAINAALKTAQQKD